ncbi:hypothetical protein J416_06223 [Gracilibacillus halophilus YIM-C55.5]|uniref:WCX domain-containing protein n=1 Tax=Gracilibacillus halophilus YIM-C55.5 TaxID=1308866 RepID=N4WTD7_9BACI|nr:hypothetical protein J416_06223 [Gracilibacillus halophilus YIM-C55.5]
MSHRVKESIFSEDQQIEELDHYAIRFKATLNGKQSIKKWILGMGINAEVIAPESLKEEIKAELQMMLKMYMKSQDTPI